MSRKDFELGCPLAASALEWCKVLQDRWVLLHYAVKASFPVGRWSARACLPVRFSVLWPAAWVACLDKSRGSKSAEVRRVWEVYDEPSLSAHPAFWEGVRSALLAGDVSSAWSMFGRFRLRSLWFVPLSRLVPLLLRLVFGWDVVLLSLGMCLLVVSFALILALGMVRPFICSRVFLFLGLSCFGAGLAVFFRYWTVFPGMVSLSLAVWSLVHSGMRLLLLVPVVPLVALILLSPLLLAFHCFGNHVQALYDAAVDFLHKVVVHRADVAVRGWRYWMLEDDKVHLYRWLKPDLVAPAPFLCCNPGLTVGDSGVISDPDRMAWLPFFCRAGRGAVDLSFCFLIGK